jgi:hypothetical protein
LLKRAAKIVTFRQNCTVRRNSFPNPVSFRSYIAPSLHLAAEQTRNHDARGYFFAMETTGFVDRRDIRRLVMLTRMSMIADFAGATNQATASRSDAGKDEAFDLGFLPVTLTMQCRSLIESYHDVHGFACLPDMLWKFRLGPFIEKQPELRQFLRRASTTRSAKKSNEGFVKIATAILSIEILASSFAGWSAIYPEAGETARGILQRNGRSPHMPLMEFYLYPPKYISSAAVATLSPPAARRSDEAELYRTSRPELAGERRALTYANSIREAIEDATRGRTANG